MCICKWCGKPAIYGIFYGREDFLMACADHVENAKMELADKLHLNSTVNIESKLLGKGGLLEEFIIRPFSRETIPRRPGRFAGESRMKFRKKPIIVEAVRWKGDNWDEVCDFLSVPLYGVGDEATLKRDPSRMPIIIRTLEGDMRAELGDWIIRGVSGEFYPIKDDIFRETYEEVIDQTRKNMDRSNKLSRIAYVALILYVIAVAGVLSLERTDALMLLLIMLVLVLIGVRFVTTTKGGVK